MSLLTGIAAMGATAVAGPAAGATVATIGGSTQWQTQAARDAGRCAHAQSLYQKVMSGYTGLATDWQGNNPMPILEQINKQRTSAATAAGKACYEQVWQALIAAGKIPGQGAASGATPQQPDTIPQPALSAPVPAVGHLPLWVVLALGVGAGWYVYRAMKG